MQPVPNYILVATDYQFDKVQPLLVHNQGFIGFVATVST